MGKEQKKSLTKEEYTRSILRSLKEGQKGKKQINWP